MNKKLPTFKITGRLDTDIVNINEEIMGAFAVEVMKGILLMKGM